MKNRGFYLFVILFIFSLTFASSLETTQIFYDDLETNNFATTWTNDANNEYSRSNVAPANYLGSFGILADGGSSEALLTISSFLNIANQTSCTISSVMRIHSNLDGNEYICMDYSTNGGTTWNLNTGTDGVLGGLCQDGNTDTEDAWRNVSISSLSGTLLGVRFRIKTNNNNEDAYIDNINVTCDRNSAPVISNISSSSLLLKGGSSITIYANTSSHGVNDEDNESLSFYCDSTNLPTAVNTDCTGGITTDANNPYIFTCSYLTLAASQNNTIYCRVYDGNSYSSTVNLTYETDYTAPTTSIVSVAGDTSASYFDTINDANTEVIISGESSMLCRWSSSDLSYSSMSNSCSISGSQANCSISDVISQGFHTRYVSCQDSLTNEQNSSNNLNIGFFLDYTTPTTSDDSVQTVKLPNYTVTISETDNVDLDPTSFYCTSSSLGCTPSSSIDNGGQIIYTESNRGANYLRYYSIDDAGNVQTIINKTININRFPILLSAEDGISTIRGGNLVNITTQSSDVDSGQEISLYVCNSTLANSSGCIGNEYCSSIGTSNLSCSFNSANNSGTYNWFAFIFDELGDAAVNNSISGSYTTDFDGPIITVLSPLNQTYSQNSITVQINTNEIASLAWYNLDGNETANITMNNISSTFWSAELTGLTNKQYNISFYANDSYNNLGNSSIVYFSIDSTAEDNDAPIITIYSPVDNSYYTTSSVLINISSNENLSFAGYKLNSGSITMLDNVSRINWNASLTLSEGECNITIYSNDSSTNKNSVEKNLTFYVDLNNPHVAFSCNGQVNDSSNVFCNGSLSDNIGLDYLIISYNASGIFVNSSQNDLTGKNASFNYSISNSSTSPGIFTVKTYVYDLAGRINSSEEFLVEVIDDIYPLIYNITYQPNSIDELDPGVTFKINVTIIEDYSIADVVFMYKNSSDSNWSSLSMGNLSAKIAGQAIIYNTSIVFGQGNWTFKINASDTVGNQNISDNITISVENENSFVNLTNIENIKTVGIASRQSNNSLGWIFINNTGDNALNFTIYINSSLSRFNINYTYDDNITYSINSGQAVNITLLVNTTGLSSGLYSYNITIESLVGTSTIERILNIGDGPLLQIVFDTFSSSVIRGQTNVEYSSQVTNFGNSDATDLELNISIPSGLTLKSGNLSRDLGALGVGISSTNTLTVDVSSSISSSSLSISTIATSSNAESVSSTRSISVIDPIVISSGSSESGSSGGSSGGISSGGGGSEPYYKEIYVVRGKNNTFEIDLINSGLPLVDLKTYTLDLDQKFYNVDPSIIKRLENGGEAKFFVTISVPTYEILGSKGINFIIDGKRESGSNYISYSDKKRIKVIVVDESKEDIQKLIEEAQEAINMLKEKGYNFLQLEILIKQAKSNLESGNYIGARAVSEGIISAKNDAIKANEEILFVLGSIINSDKFFFFTGNALLHSDLDLVNSSLIELVNSEGIYSENVKELFALAVISFERGDYQEALARIERVRQAILLEKKENVKLYLRIYWPYFLILLLVLLAIGLLIRKNYRKIRINSEIKYLDKEETAILKNIRYLQTKYFSGKLSSKDYHNGLIENEKSLSKLRTKRTSLRNTRVKILSMDKNLKSLEEERDYTEKELKRIQQDYFVNKNISKESYDYQFNSLLVRLSEIENEESIIKIEKNKKKYEGKWINIKQKD